MGVADLLKFSFSLPMNHPTGGGGKKNTFLRWRPSATQPRKPFQWTRICGFMLFALGLISLLTGHIVSHLDWYSQRLGKRSFLDMSRQEPIDLWKSKYSNFFYGCSGRGKNFPPAIRERSSNGYLLIAASGGLNQQRTGITDAVVVARILNATLVVPELDHHSFWKDDSEFGDIFDVNWFISYLSKDVTVVKKVPVKIMRSMEKPPYTMRVPRKSPPEYFLDQVLPILSRRRVRSFHLAVNAYMRHSFSREWCIMVASSLSISVTVLHVFYASTLAFSACRDILYDSGIMQVLQLTKFDYRLANELDEELQKLRCRVNYHALRFTKPIQSLGMKVVKRMRKMAKRFVAVHLRFEADMLAFSGCYFGGGEKERAELREIRKRWDTLPDVNPVEERKRGKCPLTPHEVGLMLRALGFGNDTYIYVASGEIYGGEETLTPLRELFPKYYTKEMLAKDELKPLIPYSSRLAAIDYIVCDESDVFIANNNGNMAKILAGRRRYMGHKRTIRPNGKKLSGLMMEREKMEWESFGKKVKECEGDEMREGRGEFHEFPHSCICHTPFSYKTEEEEKKRSQSLNNATLGEDERDEVFPD